MSRPARYVTKGSIDIRPMTARVLPSNFWNTATRVEKQLTKARSRGYPCAFARSSLAEGENTSWVARRPFGNHLLYFLANHTQRAYKCVCVLRLDHRVEHENHVYIENSFCSATSSQEQTELKITDCTLACGSVSLSTSRPSPLLPYFYRMLHRYTRSLLPGTNKNTSVDNPTLADFHELVMLGPESHECVLPSPGRSHAILSCAMLRPCSTKSSSQR